MRFNYTYLTLLTSTLSVALPLEGASKPRELVQRAKSYAIVNVDGGSSTAPPPEPSTVVEDKTKTVKVTNAAPTVTDVVTATVISTPTPTPTSSKCSSSSPAVSTKKPPQSIAVSSNHPKETPAPSVVTIIVTESSGPTEYYDNGLWHTSYAVKTFEAVTTLAPSEPTNAPSSNETQGVWRR